MTIHVVSYNIHKGIGWRINKKTLSGIYNQLVDLHPEIVFIQEIRGYQLELLPPNKWPYTAYGKNTLHTIKHYGNAILSTHPIHIIENINLSTKRYERRGLLYAVITIPHINDPIHLISTHLGLLRNDRKKQLKIIASFINEHVPTNEKIIIGGDLNDWQGDATQVFINQLGLQEAFLTKYNRYARTFPAWAPILALDRIYYRGFELQNAVRYAKSPWKSLSDHLAIGASLRLKENKSPI